MCIWVSFRQEEAFCRRIFQLLTGFRISAYLAVGSNPVLQPDVIGHPEIFMWLGPRFQSHKISSDAILLTKSAQRQISWAHWGPLQNILAIGAYISEQALNC